MASYPSSMDVGEKNNTILRPIAFEVEICESPYPPCVPKRVRRRLQESHEGRSKPPSSIQEIEAKLKEADQRRQQFHEWLANKARPKVKSPTHPRPPEDLAGRLHTKLVAAEQKRLEFLAQEQMRLARLEEARVAARTEVQLRAGREREQLESRVESRGHQAEVNRLALLKAERQKRALIHERVAQSILQRTTQEGKAKERMEALRALICQKIAAADEKREGLLEAEKKRAQAVVLQARKVAKAVRKKREVELRRKKEFLEARLQRAKRRRAEYLGQRGGCQGASHHNGHKMKKYGDQLCRKLTRCWRQFRRSRRTTLTLAQDFAACDISSQSVVSLPFDELAARITAPATLRVVKALLARIESRFMLPSASGSNVAQLDHLLKRLYPPAVKPFSGHGTRMAQKGVNRQNSARNANKESGSKGAQNGANPRSAAQKAAERSMDRYPVRVFLCAYMILGHPEAVFSGRGEREVRLSEAALKLIPEFEALVSTILVGPQLSRPSSPGFSDGEKTQGPTTTRPFPVLLADFDAAWCSYLYHFVVWKVPDARSLEDDMIRMACRFETAMLGVMSEDSGVELNHDNQAIKEQVLTDQRGLRERILQLTGSAGISRMETALVEARKQFLEARENKSLSPSPFASPRKSSRVSSSPPPLPTAGVLELEPKDRMVNVSKSLLSSFNETENTTTMDLEKDKKSFDNEKVVNDMLHEPSGKIFEVTHVTDKATSSKLAEIQAQIKKTMEDAFWDGVLEGLNRDPPDYNRIVGLMEEIKLELESLVPDAWKRELYECMDVEIFGQVLQSGSYDYEYFHKLLDSALNIVLKIGAPARDDDVRASHSRMIEELAQSASEHSRSSFALSLVKGLRFVLQQVQVVKADISAARIQALTPILQGSAGIEYLQKAFSKRHMLPDALSHDLDWVSMLPRTTAWLKEVEMTLQQDEEQMETSRARYRSTLSETGPIHGIPSSMRTGGRVMVTKTVASPVESVSPNEYQVLEWRSIRTLVSLGMLRLVSGVTPVTEESIPESAVLNTQRLRSAQDEYQRILVLATGLLLLRQNMVARGVVGPDLDHALKLGREQLEHVLDNPEVSVSQIGALLANVANGSLSSNDEEIMTRLLNRSLSPEDTVFRCVSTAIKSGLRAIVLLGKGSEGVTLVSASLQRAGALGLQELVVNLGVKLEKLASISCVVHGPLYSAIMGLNL